MRPYRGFTYKEAARRHRGDDTERAVLQAQDILSKNPVVFDTEAIGPNSEIVEIAAVDGDGEVLLNSLVKPHTRGTRYIGRGITDQELINAPSILELWPQVSRAFTGRMLLSYNLAHDTQSLWRSIHAHGVSSSDRRLLWDWGHVGSACIMELYAQFHGEWREAPRSYTWQSLFDAIKQCRLSYEDKSHQALSDAKAALAVLKHIAATPVGQVRRSIPAGIMGKRSDRR